MMFKRLGIGSKILIAFLAIAIAAVGIIGIVSATLATATLGEESFNKLTAVREMKAGQIEDYYQLIVDQIITLSEDRMIIDAMRVFDESVHTVGGELQITDADRENMDAELRRYYEEEYLPRLIPNLLEEASVSDYWPEDPHTRLMQSLYIAENPYPTGSKDLLDNPGDGSSYSQAHEIYHPVIRDFLERFGYYDIFLVDVDTGGHISYSVFKEVDYGTSLLEGPYSDTNFAQAYRAARDAGDPDFVEFVDFQPYAPSYNAPAAFMASPIFDGDEKIGVLVLQMPIDRINDVMTSGQNWSDVGLGDSGETYIVGDDYLLRNQSRFLIEDSENYFKMLEEIGVPLETRAKIRNFHSTIGLQEVITEGTQAALSGETGTDIFPDYRGVPVLSAYRPLNIAGVNWAIMSEIDEAEAYAAIQALTNRGLLVFAGLVAMIVVAAVVFSRSITRPIDNLTSIARELAEGNLDVQVDTQRGDEIGELARSFDVMRGSLKQSIQELQDINQHLEERVAERTAELEEANKVIGDQLSFTRTLLDTIPNPIFAKGADHRYTTFNRAYEEAYGVLREDHIGKTVMDVDHLSQEDRERFWAEDAALLEAGGTNHSELDVLFADGELHSVLQWVTTFEQSDGSIGGILGITADISEQKRMERAVAQEKEMLEHTIESLTYPFYVIDVEDYSIQLANSAAKQLSTDGISTCYALTHRRDAPCDSREDPCPLVEVKRTKMPFKVEHVHSDADGNRTFAEVHGYPIFDEAGNVVQMIEYSLDITERKLLEMELERANERMLVELNFAREIQMNMLPLIFPAFPRREDIDIFATLHSAREVGGDFYDFYFLDDDHLCFVIADVSGKGAPGALLMAVSKTLIKSRAAEDHAPASILTHVNNELSRDNESAMFVTVFLAILNVKTGELEYTNAGHNPPYIQRSDGTVELVDAFHGPVIGALPGMTYGQDRTILNCDDMIILYTDGVTEAMDESQALFSDERFAELLRAKHFESPKAVIEKTVNEVTAHQGEAEQADDITILVVQYTGQPEEIDQDQLRLKIKNQLAELGLVEERFHEFALQNDIPDAVRQPISIVLDEMLNNIVSYAYEDEDEHEIEVHIELSGRRLVLTIKDDGVPFNPFGRGAPDTSLSAEDREIGGLGIHLVRNMMDEYLYQRQINMNVVTLVKMIDGPSS